MHTEHKPPGRAASNEDPAWVRLIESYGTIEAVCRAFGGITKRTLHYWRAKHHIPRGPVRSLVVSIFRGNNIQPPHGWEG